MDRMKLKDFKWQPLGNEFRDAIANLPGDRVLILTHDENVHGTFVSESLVVINGLRVDGDELVDTTAETMRENQ